MEKYKFRATVYLVFLFVSLFVNGLLLYMLISGHTTIEECKVDEPENKDITSLMIDANKIYKDAYELINGEASNFYIPSEFVDKNNPTSACYLVNFNGLEKYFTDDLRADLTGNLIISDGNLYDCNDELTKKMFVSLFGVTDQGLRDLNYIMDNDDILLVSGKLSYNEFISGDPYPLYMIFKRVDGKLLIDSFE